MESVRLTTPEIDSIIAEAKNVLGSGLLRIRLHGSRADLRKKGGDIDLVFEVHGIPGDKFTLTQSIRQGLCARLGEQKVDILIISDDVSVNSARENNFYSMIQSGSKVIWSVYE